MNAKILRYSGVRQYTRGRESSRRQPARQVRYAMTKPSNAGSVSSGPKSNPSRTASFPSPMPSRRCAAAKYRFGISMSRNTRSRRPPFSMTLTGRNLPARREIRANRPPRPGERLHAYPAFRLLKRGLVKVELGLCKGKKLYDKRSDIRDRDMDRDIQRALRRRNKG